MKSLYESLLTGKVTKPRAKVRPSSKKELEQLISEHIKEIKPRPGQEVDLNWIDISEVDDLSGLFRNTNYIPVIDTWKIDRVKNFSYMFADNEHIARSPLPVLQKKLLVPRCYGGMFFNCTSLEEPPVLPATNLVPQCYSGMFQGCKSLVRAPQLPAKEMRSHCYSYMFHSCTALVEPPELPATELASSCYDSMFEGCRSLVEPPELPAKKLVTGCYDWMFNNCKSLKNKAKIPAEVNDKSLNCCGFMYNGCPCNK